MRLARELGRHWGGRVASDWEARLCSKQCQLLLWHCRAHGERSDSSVRVSLAAAGAWVDGPGSCRAARPRRPPSGTPPAGRSWPRRGRRTRRRPASTAAQPTTSVPALHPPSPHLQCSAELERPQPPRPPPSGWLTVRSGCSMGCVSLDRSPSQLCARRPCASPRRRRMPLPLDALDGLTAPPVATICAASCAVLVLILTRESRSQRHPPNASWIDRCLGSVLSSRAGRGVGSGLGAQVSAVPLRGRHVHVPQLGPRRPQHAQRLRLQLAPRAGPLPPSCRCARGAGRGRGGCRG